MRYRDTGMHKATRRNRVGRQLEFDTPFPSNQSGRNHVMIYHKKSYIKGSLPIFILSYLKGQNQ